MTPNQPDSLTHLLALSDFAQSKVDNDIVQDINDMFCDADGNELKFDSDSMLSTLAADCEDILECVEIDNEDEKDHDNIITQVGDRNGNSLENPHLKNKHDLMDCNPVNIHVKQAAKVKCDCCTACTSNSKYP